MTQLFGSATSRRREFLIDSLHIFVLAGFAVAQPLYDLLGRQAEFFIAHRAKPIDLLLLVFVLSFGIPLSLVLIEVATSLFGRIPRKAFHTLFVAGLVALVVLPTLKKLDGLPSMTVVGFSGLLGCLFVGGYVRFPSLRIFLTVISPSLILFPILFLFASPASRVFLPKNVERPTMVGSAADVPIVMLVFDGLPLTSLLNEGGQIDSDLFPNLANLAGHAYWFRNATTVAEGTTNSIPAFLTGIYPTEPRLPTAAEHPTNLFNLLRSSHRLYAYELSTNLCTYDECLDFSENRSDEESSSDRLATLASDLKIVYAHLVLPDRFARNFPSISAKWRDFDIHPSERAASSRIRGKKEGTLGKVPHNILDERARVFYRTIAHITGGEEPALYYIHTMLPHLPWSMYPSGTQYTLNPETVDGLDYEAWLPDPWAVLQAYQRQLLQVRFVDKLVGALVSRLQEVDLYDRALVIVLSDHGQSFRPGDKRRLVTDTNYGEIMPVPLLMKLPHQKKGVVSDRNTEIVDVFPTVTDVLGIQVDWKIDGISVLSERERGDSKKVIYADWKNQPRYYDDVAAKRDHVVKQQLARFSMKTDDVFTISDPPYSGLVGQELSDVPIAGKSEHLVEIDQGAEFFNISDRNGGFLPGLIRGRIISDNDSAVSPSRLAVSINGTIRAIARVSASSVEGSFSALVPEDAFAVGRNDVEIFVVEENGGHPALWATSRALPMEYTLANDNGSERLRRSDRKTVDLSSPHFRGEISTLILQGNKLKLSGWAVNPERLQAPSQVVVLAENRSICAVRVNADKRDVASAFASSKLLRSGFATECTIRNLDGKRPLELRFFALFEDGSGSEVKINPKVRANRLVTVRQLGPSHVTDLRHSVIDIGPSYRMTHNDAKLGSITRGDGREFPMRKALLRSNASRTIVAGDHLIISGWVVDIQNSTVPQQLVVFANGKFVYSGGVWLRRQDVADALGGNPRFMHSGFRYSLPLEVLGDLDTLDLRIFAVSKGIASELVYGQGYTYRKRKN